MPDLSSEQFQRSLTDDIAWCKMKSSGMDADSEDIRQRYALETHFAIMGDAP